MRYFILIIFAVFLTFCPYSYKLTLMPRYGGTIYHDIATGDSISSHENLTIPIDDTTYSGTWTAMKDPNSSSNSVTVINTPQSEYNSPLSAAMASSATIASAAMASASSSRGSRTGSALLSSPEGHGLRREFQYGGRGVGDGVCIDDNGRLYEMQIAQQLIEQTKPMEPESQQIARQELTKEEKGRMVIASPDSPNPEALRWSEKSFQYLQQGQWAEAIRTATAAISLDPNLSDPYVNRAWAYTEKGLYDKALEDCESALRIDPRNAKAANNRGLTYMRMGEKEKAIQDYREACNMGLDVSCQNFKGVVGYLPSEEVPTLLKYSEDSFSQGDYDRVIALSTKVIELQPDNAEAYSNRCGAKATQGLLTDAKADCLKAIDLNPSFAMAYNNYGFVLKREGNIKEAAIYYEISCGLGSKLGCQNQRRISSSGILGKRSTDLDKIVEGQKKEELVRYKPSEILTKNNEAVVLVRSYDRAGKLIGHGTGFNVHENGVIVTNLHVVLSGGSYLEVKFPKHGTYENVYIAGFSDIPTDLAVLAINGKNLPKVNISSVPVKVGDKIYTISNPEGLLYTLSEGLVSAEKIVDNTKYYQISAPISEGSSGGAVFNEFGQVIGVASMVMKEGQNLNFAISIEEFAKIATFEKYFTLKDFMDYIEIEKEGNP